jgi:hypothetical protein
MPLKIQTTGIEQYAPGGGATLKMMLIGGPSAGKTRMSSYWPKPIYADCEGGLASVADRKVPFVSVNNSQDMLDFLAYLKLECRRPYADRDYQTVVIDTLDAFHRKLKDEWLQNNPSVSAFRGFDAWGFLETKMQMLLTRLLNLDMNVIVNCHFRDKTIKEGTGDNATERQELMLQLQGDVKDSVFNDFDLVGWLGTYWDVEGGQRVEKRGLTFKKTPDKPFLKDRLHITPPWMEVQFDDADYASLFGAFTARLDDLADSQEIGEIPSEVPDQVAWQVTSVGSGPLPVTDPKDIPLAQLDKPTLQTKARELGLVIKGNTLKGELVTIVSNLLQEMDDEQQDAVDLVQGTLGGQVISNDDPTDAPPMALDSSIGAATPTASKPPAPAPAPVAKGGAACQKCGVDTTPQNQDYVKIGRIKFRLLLCNEHFAEAKAAPNAAWIKQLQQNA